MQKQNKKFIPWFTLISSIAALIFAGYLYVSTQLFLTNAIFTSGKVVELSKHPTRGGYTYAPQIAFTDNSGNSHLWQSTLFESPAAYAINDIVSIAYSPTSPDQARIYNTDQLYFIPKMIAIAAGIGFFLVALMASLHHRNPPKNIH